MANPPKILPADFQGFDAPKTSAPPKTLPANFDFTSSTPPPPAPVGLEAKLRANPAYSSQVGAEQVAGVKKIAGSVQQGAKEMQGTPLDFSQGKDYAKSFTPQKIGSAALGAYDSATGAISGAGQVALAPFTPAISKIVSFLTPALRQANPQIAQAFDALMPKITEAAKNNPEAATRIGNTVDTLLWLVGGGEATKATEGAFSKDAIQGVKGEVKAAAKDIANYAGDKSVINSTEKALKNITPKIDELKNPEYAKALKTADPETTFSKGTTKLSPNLKKTALDNPELLQGNPTQNYQSILKKSSDLFKETNTSLEGKTFKPTDLSKNIESSASKITPPSTISSTEWNKKIKEIVTNIIEQNKTGDASKLRQYILDYRKENQGALDTLFGGKEKSANKLIDSIETSMNETLAKDNPSYATNVQKLKDLKQLSDWNYATMGESAKKSSLGRFMKQHPVAGTIAGAAGTLLLGEVGRKTLTGGW